MCACWCGCVCVGGGGGATITSPENLKTTYGTLTGKIKLNFTVLMYPNLILSLFFLKGSEIMKSFSFRKVEII